MRNKAYKDQIGQLRFHRANGDETSEDSVKLKTRLLPLFREIDKIVSVAQKEAELMFMNNNPSFNSSVISQQLADKQMKEGNVPAAIQTQKREKTQQLLQMNK